MGRVRDLGLDVLALALVFVLVFGPVLALALSFAAFVLLWIGDRPVRERPLGETWVRVEELREPAPDDLDDDEPAAGAPEDEGRARR